MKNATAVAKPTPKTTTSGAVAVTWQTNSAKDGDGPYFVNYLRKGDRPDGGEMYGSYATRQQAEQAVARIQKWAAEINRGGEWDIAKIEVSTLGSTAKSPEKSAPTSQPGRLRLETSKTPSALSATSQPSQAAAKKSNTVEKFGNAVATTSDALGKEAARLADVAKAQSGFAKLVGTNAASGKMTPDRSRIAFTRSQQFATKRATKPEATLLRTSKATPVGLGKVAKVANGVGVVAKVGVAAYNIANAPDGQKTKVAVQEGAGIAAETVVSTVTTSLGMTACATLLATPAAPLAPVCGIGVFVASYYAGDKAGEFAKDRAGKVYDKWNAEKPSPNGTPDMTVPLPNTPLP